MIMGAKTNCWLREGAGWEDYTHIHTWLVNGWLWKLPVVEIFDVSSAEIIVLVNLKAFDEQIWVPELEYPASK